MIIEIFVFVSVFLAASYYWSRRHLFILGGRLPSPKGFPIIGNALMFFESHSRNYQTIVSLLRSYKRLLAIWIGPLLNVMIFTAKDTETILKSKSTMKADGYRFLRPWLGESILISEGQKFKQNKKLLMSAFQIPNLKQYVNVFSEYAEILVKKLEENVDGKEFDVHPYLSLSTMAVLLETSMGVKKETLGSEALAYSKAVERLGRCAHIRGYKAWLHPEIVFRYSSLKKKQDESLNVVHPLTEKVINERKAYLKNDKSSNELGESNRKWPIFIDKFLEAKDENGIGLSDQDIKDEVMTMMFAGQDTTTVSIGFALCLLGLHQDIQDKLLEEVVKVLGDSDRRLNYEDCKNLQYMEQVIQETWRLYPPIPLIAKKLTEDVDLGEYVLPRLCSVVIIIMQVHRDPAHFPEPERFNPDNFTLDRVKERNPYCFIPFSAGQRTCIGQKYAMLLIKVTLSYIIRNYRIFSTIQTRKYKLSTQTTLKRKDGFMISLKRRK